MALPIGFLLLVLGLVAFWGWWPAMLVFLKGLTAFSLVFWGFIALLLGYSERKAKREFAAALQDAPSPAENAAEEPRSGEDEE